MDPPDETVSPLLRQMLTDINTNFKAAGQVAVNTGVIEGIRPPNYADIALEQDTREEFNKFGIIEGIVDGLVKSPKAVIASPDNDRDKLRKAISPFVTA